MDACGCVIAEHTESLKGQTQHYSAVGLFSHKSLMSKFAFHFKEALCYEVMVDKMMALLRIIYSWCYVKQVAVLFRLSSGAC